MAVKITVAELDINEKAFVKSAETTKKAIDELVVSQKKLSKQGETNSQQFVKNDAQLKKLRSEYTQQKNAINALQSPYAKLSKTLQIARNNAKNLAVEFGVNSKQAKAARVEVNKLDTQLKSVDKSVGQSQRNVGNYGSAIKGITASFLGWTAVVYGAIRALKDMFNRVVEFDKTMVGLSAILGVNREEIKDLEITITEVAGASIKTSTEVAALATTLITLGKSKEEVIQLLKPVNDLSIALGATSDEAGELLVQTLNAFGKGSDSAKEYADIIAKMRTSTALDFERIKDSLGFLAPTAKAVGLSFENTGAILGTLVDNGIKAARAGRLMSSSFIKLGAAGITLDEALEQINNSEDKLTTASKLLGVQSASLGLILADNTEKTAELTKEFENSAGALDNLTKKQLESLEAKLKILDSTWEKLIFNIESGTGGLSNFFKSAIVGATNFLDRLSDINTTSEGYFSFAAGAWKSFIFGQGDAIKAQADGVRQTELQIVKAKELVDLLIIENNKLGVKIDKQALVNQLSKLNVEQINEQINAVKQQQVVEEEINTKKDERTEKEKNDLILRKEQEIIEHEANLEFIQLRGEEVNELQATILKAGLDNELLLKENSRKAEKILNEQALKERQRINKKIIDESINLVGQQTRLGQALIAIKGVMAAKETLIDLGVLKAKVVTNTAGATADIAAGTAKTAKVGFPQNIPLLIGFAAQVAGIIGAIKGAAGAAKNTSVPKFYEGGQVPTGTGGAITGQNIPTQQGGDNILATVKSGEVILNENQQAAAGGDAFFKSIGVPGFADGGVVAPSSITTPIQQSNQTNEQFDLLAQKINDIKIVAIESDITDAQVTQAEIIDGATI